MARALKSRSRKAGLPPGTLIHIGQKKADTQKITVMDYDEKGVQEYEVQDIQQCAAHGGIRSFGRS
jgi:magnesium transporter